MGARMGISLNTLFRLLSMSSFNGFLHQKLHFLAATFWFSVSAMFLTLFGFLARTIFRIKGNASSRIINSNCFEFDSNCVEQEAEAEKPEQISEQEAEAKNPKVDIIEFNDTRATDDIEEEETPKFFFKFQYQTYRENYEPVVLDSVSATTTNKYEFFTAKDSSLFVEKPEVFSLTVKDLYADSKDGAIGNKEIFNDKILHNQKLIEQEVESEPIPEERKEIYAEKLEAETCNEGSISRKITADDFENSVESDQQVSKKDGQILSEKDFITPDFDSNFDSDSITSSHELISRFAASSSDGFFSEKDFEDAFELITLRDTEEDLEFEGMNLQNLTTGYDPNDIDEEDSDILEELENLEEPNMQNSGDENIENLSEEEVKDEQQQSSASKDSSGLEGEDSNGLEILWEHQELIEQLKMELKKVRATGLPTIMEDDESPKIMEDLKPWKIDDKFQHEDRMGELHKFYKSYRERMRKFDILNYQKMYAMGFLQSKYPQKSISSSSKGSASALTSLVSQKFQLGKRKKNSIDPMMSFIRELHSDLEMVYVGQMCLSWEILHWQYQKALEIWESDPYGLGRYNEVAGEFQQFQVLMQRFIENEPFEGPRIQNYVKNRCVLRNLLQVPVIREDSMKDKKRVRNRNDNDHAIKSDGLVEIMEESIRIFWRFVRADKDSHNVIQKRRKGTQIQPQDPTELELSTKIRASLQKKERKLKDILRSGSCILRKFQKQEQESSTDQVLYFFSQVDMKLVSRVLNMSKITTDQLIWCRSKLNKINFVSRKIHVEPSFLLFPC